MSKFNIWHKFVYGTKTGFYSVYYEYDEETFIQLQYVVDTKMEDEEIEKVILDSFHSFRYLD